MNIQLLFEDGKGSVIDKYGRPEPMNYTIDEEHFRLETLSSPTQYFAQFPLESENKAEIMQMKKETKASQSVYLPSRTKKPSNLFYLFAKTWLLDVLSWVLTVSHFRKYTTKAEHQGSMEPVLQDNNKSNAESSKSWKHNLFTMKQSSLRVLKTNAAKKNLSHVYILGLWAGSSLSLSKEHET
ncbi:hypothetical protein F4703DRAFT_1922970 [Phycomyces blakesleeanus]